MLQMDQESKFSAACSDLALQVLSLHGHVRVKVFGWSMLPALWPGDEVTVERSDITKLEAGQIAVTHRHGRITAHRIRSIGRDHLITRGDSLRTCDPLVRPDEIAGRVVSVHRNGRDLDPRQTFWHRIGASILRSSDLCSRAAVFLGRRFRPSMNSGSSTPVEM
jgi:hypothetical protein